MAIEREHKYLVIDNSYKNMSCKKIVIKQGYLSREKERTVRVRLSDDKGYLTVKGKTAGDSRLEFEYQVPYADAKEMLKMCEGAILEKDRYIVIFDGKRWEIDEFKGEKYGLVVAEIELDESETGYSLPPFVGKNVTGNPEYYNSNL